jgi:hypothetical protein
MQMIRIKDESWIIVIVTTRWYLKFKVFVRDVFLLKIHATEESGVSSEFVRTEHKALLSGRGTDRTTLIS